MYMNVNTITHEHLSEAEVEFLEQHAGDDLYLLVRGDDSLHRGFCNDLLTLDQALIDCSENEDIVLAENPAIIPTGFTLSKSYWGDPMLTKNED